MSEPQTQMRQPPPAVREPRGDAVGASWMTWLTERQFLRGLAIAATAGAFLALVGAFGTGAMPLTLRLAYWIGVSLLGAVFGNLSAFLIQRRAGFDQRPWFWAAVLTVGMSIPFTLVIFLITTVLFGGAYTVDRLIGYFPPVLLVTAAITGINFLVHRRVQPAPASTAAVSDDRPRFLERLPLKLRGAELWAVEAEDHYLRLHTSKGQDLILMRLSDAVSELGGLEGARTHRSWWVARGAVTDVKRGDGRATLTLKDGAQIPVSRAYARELRAAGWF